MFYVLGRWVEKNGEDWLLQVIELIQDQRFFLSKAQVKLVSFSSPQPSLRATC